MPLKLPFTLFVKQRHNWVLSRLLRHVSKVQLSRIPKHRKFKQSIYTCNFSSLSEYFYQGISWDLGTITAIYGYLWINIRRNNFYTAKTRRFRFLWKISRDLPAISVNIKALCIPLWIKQTNKQTKMCSPAHLFHKNKIVILSLNLQVTSCVTFSKLL